MTSSNVTSLLQGVGVSQDINESFKPAKSKDLNFEDMLSKASGARNDNPVPKAETSNSDTESSSEVSFKSSDINKTDSATETTVDTDKEEIVEKVEEFTDAVKSVIKEELGVDDKAIEVAMENLGLTAIDLLNPQNLAQLVLALSNETDSINLVLSEDFKNIFDEVMGLANEILNQNGIDLNSLKEFASGFSLIEGSQETGKIDISQMEMVSDDKSVEIPVEEIETIIKNQDNSDGEKLVSPETASGEEETIPMANPKESTDNPKDITLNISNESHIQKTNPKESFEGNSDDILKKNPFDLPKDNNPLAGTENQPNPMNQFTLTYSAEEDVVILPEQRPISSQEIVDQFIEQARVINMADSTTMEITLNPEGLGKIFMQVVQHGDQIVAKLFTENDAVKAALENQMATLRTELNQSSEKVTSIEVAVSTHEFEKNLEEGMNDRNNQDAKKGQEEKKRPTRIDLNNLDSLSGLMSDEDILTAQIMKDNGNTLNYQV
ncbi:MAG: flagellar hook-length control protein FliK [Pseudobutyrivibrio sp.]|nr:flagellar hook-length control protein FliK [Pseudobutyrivibrio sp.]